MEVWKKKAPMKQPTIAVNLWTDPSKVLLCTTSSPVNFYSKPKFSRHFSVRYMHVCIFISQAKRGLGRFIGVEGENINRSAGVIVATAIRSWWLPLPVLVKINHDDCYVVMEVSSYSLFYPFYVIVPHLPFLCSHVQGCSHQSLRNALQNFENSGRWQKKMNWLQGGSSSDRKGAYSSWVLEDYINCCLIT